MKRFKSILVYLPPLGETQRALERAVKLARHNAAKLMVIDVASERPLFLEGIVPAATWSSLDDREDRLRIKTSWIDRGEVPFATKVLQGRPTVEIVREVLRAGHDLVIKDVHVESDDESFFFGSMDMRLMRNCPCPVWMVQPKKDVPFESVIAAIDPQAVSSQEHAMNDAIMELATSLARTEASSLYLAAAWLGPGESAVAGAVESWVMQQYLDIAQDNAQVALDAIIANSEMDIPPERVYFRHGFPYDVITTTAADISADLIIMGTLARTGVPGMLIGNTAEKVLRSVTCSTLTLKPDGFTSPITLD